MANAEQISEPGVAQRLLFSRSTVAKKLAFHGPIVVLIVALLYPMLWLVGASFAPGSSAVGSLPILPERATLDNYRDGWAGVGNIGFSTYFVNSMAISLISIVGNLFSCTMAAYAFARMEFPMKRTLFALLLLTILLPNQVTVIPQYIIFNALGMVNTYGPLLIPKFTAVDAFYTFLLVQFIRGIPQSLDEAARIDGCGHARIFFWIILPLCLPALATTAVFTFIYSWNDFLGPLLYLNSPDLYTVPLGLSQFMDATGRSMIGSLFAMSVLSLVPLVVIFAVAQRLLTTGIATTGAK
ncbi:carbohydrate ABC transporter permease [Celeribacter indicus]|uniref:Binding-protein-dependent transport systems inner membrane component n=1 Tax=Celeribacter indicus TaxID=1208324 RepID=A0A0B5E8V3_9RHOB|nr:carbohydrate ABC transporter permease [Celeribacter indicus]AJE48742.1 binding-protein-dependent transport systems inner membrane component [Celeribacter indicus]SDX11662.1 carbohydrate ABC transporter membrane protein 2, CUT1 family [Celeribacter indicus]